MMTCDPGYRKQAADLETQKNRSLNPDIVCAWYRRFERSQMTVYSRAYSSKIWNTSLCHQSAFVIRTRDFRSCYISQLNLVARKLFYTSDAGCRYYRVYHMGVDGANDYSYFKSDQKVFCIK